MKELSVDCFRVTQSDDGCHHDNLIAYVSTKDLADELVKRSGGWRKSAPCIHTIKIFDTLAEFDSNVLNGYSSTTIDNQASGPVCSTMNTFYMLLITYPGSGTQIIMNTGDKAVRSDESNLQLLIGMGERLLSENVISSYQVMSTVGPEVIGH